MKKTAIILSVITCHISKAPAQTNCAVAAERVQQYAISVNQMYQAEYWEIIPNQRCPGYDVWGRPYAPQVVYSCRQRMLGYLNQWYTQQCIYVNSMYGQLMRSCSASSSGSDEQAEPIAPGRTVGTSEGKSISTEEITAGIDEGKTVRITIPRTPAGFQGY